MDLPYEVLFTVVYTLVDEWYRRVGAGLVRSRAGVKPRFSDSEALAVELVRTLEGQTKERRWYRMVRANWLHLFPQLPERSVLHKRTKGLYLLLDHCRCDLRDALLTDDPCRLVDGTPVGPAQSRQQHPGCLHGGPLLRGLRHPIINMQQAPKAAA
jgi:hypothetical protein